MPNKNNPKLRDPHVQHLSRLVGGVVRSVIVDPGAQAEFGESVYGLSIQSPGRGGRVFNAWIMRDPEGNGPGFLDIQNESNQPEGKN